MEDNEYDIIKYGDDKEHFRIYFPHYHISKHNFKRLMTTPVGKYSISSPRISKTIIDRMKIELGVRKLNDLVITDGNGGAGGDTIHFAMNFKHVNTVEIVKQHCDIIKNNVEMYDLANKVTLYCDDYFNVRDKISQDVVYFDPPWGGKDFKKLDKVDLFMNDIPLYEIVNYYYEKVKMVVLKVPPNFNIDDFKEKVKFKRMFNMKISSKTGVVKVMAIYLT